MQYSHAWHLRMFSSYNLLVYIGIQIKTRPCHDNYTSLLIALLIVELFLKMIEVKKLYPRPNHPISANVALFGNRVFVVVIKSKISMYS